MQPITTQAHGLAALAIFALGLPQVASAELKPISDVHLGEVTGQAFMDIENSSGAAHDFTRMTLGIDVETQVNIADIKAGEINGGTDFAASHVAMGHLSRSDANAQYNGEFYNEGEAVPFEAVQPYIELAEDTAGLAGFRMGFLQARGSVSSHTTSFSGDIGITLTDADGNAHQATLFDAATQATNYRATHIGIAGAGTDCSTGAQCAPLNHLQSLIVGTDNGDGTTGFTDDFFIGFQRDSVDWQSPQGGNVITAGKGVYINLPSSSVIDMSQLAGPDGVQRLRTHQVDMGTKLF